MYARRVLHEADLQPLPGEVITVMDEEVAAVHKDVGAHPQVCRSITHGRLWIVPRLWRLPTLQQHIHMRFPKHSPAQKLPYIVSIYLQHNLWKLMHGFPN